MRWPWGMWGEERRRDPRESRAGPLFEKRGNTELRGRWKVEEYERLASETDEGAQI